MQHIVPILQGFGILWILILAVSAFFTVPTGELGAVQRFKRYVRVKKPGLRLRWPLVETVGLISSRTRENEFPADIEQVEKQDEDNVPAGKKAPFRILHRGAEEAVFFVPDRKNLGEWREIEYGDSEWSSEKWKTLLNDPMSQPITTEDQIVVEWLIDEGTIENFLENTGSEAEVLIRLEDAAARVLQEVQSRTTAGHAQDIIVHLSELIQRSLKVIVGETPDPTTGRICDRPWGIKIRNAYIKSIDPGMTINVARAKAAASVGVRKELIETSEGQAQAVKNAADANAHKIRIEGEAQRDADKARGEGERARLEAVKDLMGNENIRFLYQVETARDVLPKSNVVLMPSDIGPMAGILALGSTLDLSKKRKE